MTSSAYEARIRALGESVAGMLEALWARHESGAIDRAEFVALGAIIVAAANGQAAGLARLSVAAFVAVETGAPLPLVTTDPPEWRTDTDRLGRALETVAAAEAATIPGRLRRLGKAEPADTAAATREDVISSWDTEPGIEGWTRQLESDPCDLCRWWAEESGKFPPNARMARHTGCVCTQQPIISERTA